MSDDLPMGWDKVLLGDLAEYLNGAAFKPTDWVNEGMPIIRIQNLTDPTKPMNLTTRIVPENLLVKDGDILVSWSATLDAFIWDRGDAWLNQHIFRVLPHEKIVEKYFLFFLLKREIANLIGTEHLHGSTMKHINRGPFLSHEVA
ncbi:MAG: restriction endonuclease subunit S, partial [Pseudanabaena sp.]